MLGKGINGKIHSLHNDKWRAWRQSVKRNGNLRRFLELHGATFCGKVSGGIMLLCPIHKSNTNPKSPHATLYDEGDNANAEKVTCHAEGKSYDIFDIAKEILGLQGKELDDAIADFCGVPNPRQQYAGGGARKYVQREPAPRYKVTQATPTAAKTNNAFWAQFFKENLHAAQTPAPQATSKVDAAQTSTDAPADNGTDEAAQTSAAVQQPLDVQSTAVNEPPQAVENLHVQQHTPPAVEFDAQAVEIVECNDLPTHVDLLELQHVCGVQLADAPHAPCGLDYQQGELCQALWDERMALYHSLKIHASDYFFKIEIFILRKQYADNAFWTDGKLCQVAVDRARRAWFAFCEREIKAQAARGELNGWTAECDKPL